MLKRVRRGGGKEAVSDKTKSKIDWLQFGQYLGLAAVNSLFETVRKEFKKKSIGPEILEWLNGPGREFFLGLLVKMAEEFDRFRKRQQALAVSESQTITAEVDLDANPILLFNDAKLVRHRKQGSVIVEYRPVEDELYVNGKRFVGWSFNEELAGDAGGISSVSSILRSEADKHNPCNATLADWLFEHQWFIPKKCRKEVWYFWGSEWRSSGGQHRICYLSCKGTKWIKGSSWIERSWVAQGPSASLEKLKKEKYMKLRKKRKQRKH